MSENKQLIFFVLAVLALIVAGLFQQADLCGVEVTSVWSLFTTTCDHPQKIQFPPTGPISEHRSVATMVD